MTGLTGSATPVDPESTVETGDGGGDGAAALEGVPALEEAPAAAALLTVEMLPPAEAVRAEETARGAPAAVLGGRDRPEALFDKKLPPGGVGCCFGAAEEIPLRPAPAPIPAAEAAIGVFGADPQEPPLRPAAAPLLLTATAECPAAEDFGAAGEEPPPKPAMTPMLLLLLVAEAAGRFAAGAAAEAWGAMLPRPPRAAAGEKAPPRTAADEKAPVAEAAEADGALGLGATEPVEPGRLPERAAGATGRDPIELELRSDG